jgi:hypothetical protein
LFIEMMLAGGFVHAWKYFSFHISQACSTLTCYPKMSTNEEDAAPEVIQPERRIGIGFKGPESEILLLQAVGERFRGRGVASFPFSPEQLTAAMSLADRLRESRPTSTAKGSTGRPRNSSSLPISTTKMIIAAAAAAAADSASDNTPDTDGDAEDPTSEEVPAVVNTQLTGTIVTKSSGGVSAA